MQSIQEAHNLILPFLTMTEEQLFDKFIEESSVSKNEIIYIKPKDKAFRSLFIPGIRQDRVLLVSHADSVWLDSPQIKVEYGKNHHVFYSGNRKIFINKVTGKRHISGTGIAADDRAGCAALFTLKDLGHSILITSGEEQQLLGSRYLMSNPKMADLMQMHQFAVQFDRRGNENFVTYHVGTKPFIKYCEREMPRFVHNEGSYSDVAHLCRDICGANFSIGFQNEHSVNELLLLDDWINIVEKARSWLSSPNLPKFTR